MAHYAFLNSKSEVVQVIVGRDENDLVEGVESWETYYGNRKAMTCVQTSYNTYGGVHFTTDDEGNRVPSEDQTKALRFNYAGIGFTFDPDKGTDGAFIPAKPFESWVLDEETCLWVAPVPMPEETDADGEPVPYTWDEDAGDWVAVTEDAVE